MSFVDVIFSIVLGVFQAAHPTPSDADTARLQQVAADIWDATENAKLPFTGPAARESSALVLVTIAHHESGFWSNVQDCSLCYPGSAWCDRGKSVTLFQLREGTFAFGKFSREELCANNKLATQRALAVVGRFRGASTPQQLFDGYARGGVGLRPTRAAIEMGRLFERHARTAKVVVSYQNGALFATSADSEGKESVALRDP